jgi:hypothetical protein
LQNSFSAMEKLGDEVMRPFLQDVIQFYPLLRTLVKAAGQDLLTPFKVVPNVGVFALTDFLGHFFLLFWYTFCAENVSPVLRGFVPLVSPSTQFRLKRAMEAWKFGSGLDYEDH